MKIRLICMRCPLSHAISLSKFDPSSKFFSFNKSKELKIDRKTVKLEMPMEHNWWTEFWMYLNSIWKRKKKTYLLTGFISVLCVKKIRLSDCNCTNSKHEHTTFSCKKNLKWLIEHKLKAENWCLTSEILWGCVSYWREEVSFILT